MRPRVMFGRAIVAALAVLTAALPLVSAPAASASGKQISLFQDDDSMLQNPVPTMQELRHLGVGMVRVNVRWSLIAPDPTSRTRPNFNASNPNAYPAGAWAPYDAIVAAAKADGIQLMFNPTAFAPLWAQGSNPSKYGAHYDPEFAFMPNANQYKLFVQALAKRYPTVHTWELYNEPNFGEDLAPQAINHSNVLWAPVMYRGLLNAAWSALKSTGHGRDTTIVGALAAYGSYSPARRGFGSPGAYGETPPLQFIRDLYCLTSKYQPYRGAAAKARQCPTNAAGSRRFRSQNPALFNATAWSDHPHRLGLDGGSPPNTTHYRNPNYAGFSQLQNMLNVLDKTQKAYGSRKKFPLWNTEFGYITNPPNKSGTYVSPANQALYINWAEYLSWKNPRVASAMQFLLYDPNPSVGTPECGGFASGIVFYPSAPTMGGCAPYTPGVAKPGLDAYRLPIFLPTSSARRGQALQVWGCVRPAHDALLDTGQSQKVLIQFQQGATGAWTTIGSFTYSSRNSSCYFTQNIKFPASGSVQLSYTYPASDSALSPGIPSTGYVAGTPSVSRSAAVKIR
jgi:hypothetical protein